MGTIKLDLEKKVSGKTYISSQYFKLPLQIMSPHYQDSDGTAFVYLLNPSGGVLQHDRLYTEINLKKEAKALVTTPSSTKYYKMDDGHAEIKNLITLEEDAVLEYLPEHNVPFAQATVYQETEIRLKKSSTLISWDVITPGRVARGEIFKYDKFSSCTKIYIEDELVLLDKAIMEPEKIKIGAIGRLEGYQISGTVFVHSQKVSEELIERLNQISERLTLENKLGQKAVLAATQIFDGILLIRLLATSTIIAQDVLEEGWGLLRENLLGKEKVRIRKY